MERRALLKKVLAHVFIVLVLSFFKPTLANFSWLFSHYSLQDAIVNSIIVSLAATAISLILGTPCAFALARFSIASSGSGNYSPFYFIWMSLRLLDTKISLIVTYLVINLPLLSGS